MLTYCPTTPHLKAVYLYDDDAHTVTCMVCGNTWPNERN